MMLPNRLPRRSQDGHVQGDCERCVAAAAIDAGASVDAIIGQHYELALEFNLDLDLKRSKNFTWKWNWNWNWRWKLVGSRMIVLVVCGMYHP